MTVHSGVRVREPQHWLALLVPTATVVLASAVLGDASLPYRSAAILLFLVCCTYLVMRLESSRLRVAYGAATVGVLLPLLVFMSVDIPPESLLLQWATIGGVGAVFAYLVGSLHSQSRQVEQLDELKLSFVALANHELRTPVTVLHSTLDTLVDDLCGHLTPQQESFLLAARSSSGALAYLVEMMTQFHDLEMSPPAGRAPVVPLGSLVHSTALDLRKLFEQHGVELEIRLDPEAALSNVPQSYARIMLEQLMRNAAKFNHAGGHAAVNADVDGMHLVVMVKDDGLGIAPEAHEAIFGSFYQNGAILSRTAGGIGLGLTLTRAAVEKMQGSIELTSSPGEGSTFTVRIPLLAAPHAMLT